VRLQQIGAFASRKNKDTDAVLSRNRSRHRFATDEQQSDAPRDSRSDSKFSRSGELVRLSFAPSTRIPPAGASFVHQWVKIMMPLLSVA
jgi:hypothetical protein